MIKFLRRIFMIHESDWSPVNHPDYKIQIEMYKSMDIVRANKESLRKLIIKDTGDKDMLTENEMLEMEIQDLLDYNNELIEENQRLKSVVNVTGILSAVVIILTSLYIFTELV